MEENHHNQQTLHQTIATSYILFPCLDHQYPLYTIVIVLLTCSNSNNFITVLVTVSIMHNHQKHFFIYVRLLLQIAPDLH